MAQAEDMVRQGQRVTAVSLVILILGITAGLGPGGHTCFSQASPSCEHDCLSPTSHPASGPRVAAASEAQHLEQGNRFCVACLLKAQFNSLRLSEAPRVPPPRESVAAGGGREVLTSSLPRLHFDARAPPHASRDSSTV